MRIAALALAALGCYPPPGPSDVDPPPPDRDYVVDIVLRAYQAPPTLAGPAIRYHKGDAACGQTAVTYPGHGCVRGWYNAGNDWIDVVTWPQAAPGQLSIAHEVLHWYLFKTTGDGNPAHTAPFYQWVEYANHFVWEAWPGE